MNMLHILYGFGGLCAVMLLAYLLYALICAGEF
ncbi:MAG: potassium-transporting ATPase subunit F [Comamonadaceae bacterium]|nr:MAG: potassium-transporting ATPase subunit F [Comamonadaceae bacterium]